MTQVNFQRFRCLINDESHFKYLACFLPEGLNPRLAGNYISRLYQIVVVITDYTRLLVQARQVTE